MTRLYMDHNATSPARPEVIEAVTRAMQTIGNASAPHTDGRAANTFINDSREALGLALGVCAQDIIFTGGGTESDNTAVYSVTRQGCKRVLISHMEHPAVSLAAERSGASVEYIPVNKHGQSDLEWLAQRLGDWDANDGPPFVALCAANSETGVLQDVERATDLVHDAGGFILVDAVQALGKLSMTFQPDYMAVSAHKIGGPMGIGALYVSPNAPFEPLLCGGGQERRRRAGTLNVAAISGFGAAVNAIGDMSGLAVSRDKIEAELKAMEPELTIFGEGATRLPNTSFFAVPDMPAATLMMALDLDGISVSTGMACSSGKAQVSRAIQAMGQDHLAPKGAIRVSLGYTSQAEDADRFLDAWAKIRRKTRGTKGAT